MTERRHMVKRYELDLAQLAVLPIGSWAMVRK